MEQVRITIGWGAIVVAALAFLPLPLPALPPMLSAGMLMLVPVIGPVLMLLSPMLLIAAGIGLVNGCRKLFLVWAVIGGLAAVAGLPYDPVRSMVDLAVIGGCLVVLLWGDWRKLLPVR